MASIVVRNGRFLIMKKIRIVLLTLVLCITMLAPEFSMLPAVYAGDKTPAPSATQSADSVASAAAPAAPETSDAAGAAHAGNSADAEKYLALAKPLYEKALEKAKNDKTTLSELKLDMKAHGL